MTTTEKAKRFQAILAEINRQRFEGGIKLAAGVGILLEVDDARFLAEVLSSLQWANIYEGEDRNKIGREFLDFNTADYMGRLAEGFDYIETVGIIRLKDD